MKPRMAIDTAAFKAVDLPIEMNVNLPEASVYSKKSTTSSDVTDQITCFS